MGSVFTGVDIVIFFAFLIAAMVVGLIAGRKEDTSEDYFLAGRKIPWWGVAGSIFGSNVSANHMVGMMGIGFSIGFAQSHFELGAIAGLMILCYGFLPVYRKLNVYTLSEYLEHRYDQRSRLAYAVIMVVIMAVVQMVPALYIGARSICVLVGEPAISEQVSEGREASVGNATEEDDQQPNADGKTEILVNRTYYAAFVIALAVVAASYTVFGGLKAVIWTDVIQSVLLLAAGILVAILTFRAIGGWGQMMALDRAADGADKMHLYLPMNHAELPWTGVFTGLMFMHTFYWGTNQFIVQRALAARSDTQGRLGIIAAGYLKLLIPFFAIAAGVAAVYLFRQHRPGVEIAPDTAFTEVVKLVVPLGYGIVGVIAAGLIGAILSSIDSMMNSAATIVTVDVYKRYINPEASERRMILVGRVSIVVFVVLAALMAIFILDPNSKKNFFLQIADYQNYLTPGVLIAFLLGMFWRRGTAHAAIVTIVAGVVFSGVVQYGYDTAFGDKYLADNPRVYYVVVGQAELADIKPKDLPQDMQSMDDAARVALVEQKRETLSPVAYYLGPKLNFFHRVVGVMLLCGALYAGVSLCSPPDPQKGRMVWTDLGGHKPGDLRRLVTAILVSVAFYAALGWLMHVEFLSPTVAAFVGMAWTLAMFGGAVVLSVVKRRENETEPRSILADDRVWAGILCSLAVFMLFYFT